MLVQLEDHIYLYLPTALVLFASSISPFKKVAYVASLVSHLTYFTYLLDNW